MMVPALPGFFRVKCTTFAGHDEVYPKRDAHHRTYRVLRGNARLTHPILLIYSLISAKSTRYLSDRSNRTNKATP